MWRNPNSRLIARGQVEASHLFEGEQGMGLFFLLLAAKCYCFNSYLTNLPYYCATLLYLIFFKLFFN